MNHTNNSEYTLIFMQMHYLCVTLYMQQEHKAQLTFLGAPVLFCKEEHYMNISSTFPPDKHLKGFLIDFLKLFVFVTTMSNLITVAVMGHIYYPRKGIRLCPYVSFLD